MKDPRVIERTRGWVGSGVPSWAIMLALQFVPSSDAYFYVGSGRGEWPGGTSAGAPQSRDYLRKLPE